VGLSKRLLADLGQETGIGFFSDTWCFCLDGWKGTDGKWASCGRPVEKDEVVTIKVDWDSGKMIVDISGSK